MERGIGNWVVDWSIADWWLVVSDQLSEFGKTLIQ